MASSGNTMQTNWKIIPEVIQLPDPEIEVDVDIPPVSGSIISGSTESVGFNYW